MVLIAALALVFGLLYFLFMSPMSQVFGRYPWRKQTTEKIVALTFDDGPNEPYTSQIADFLATKHIKATFFQVGSCIQRYPEVTQRLHSDGHVIGNHSVHHRFSDHLLHPSYSKEITQNQAIIQATIGKKPAFFRSPWLWRQPWMLHTVRKNLLYPVSGQFCHSFEAFQPKATSIARRAVAKVKPGAIIIFHDGFDARGGNRAQTVEAVKITVARLTEQGYRFVTVSDLLAMAAYQK